MFAFDNDLLLLILFYLDQSLRNYMFSLLNKLRFIYVMVFSL